jgi:alpha-glucosidase
VLENIKRIRQDQSRIMIDFKQGSMIVKAITPSIIHFFTPNGMDDHGHPSKAIDGLQQSSVPINVSQETDAIVVRTEKLVIRILNYVSVNIYDTDGNVLSEAFCEESGIDERPCRVLQKQNRIVQNNKLSFRVLKKMDSEMYFYGLGDKTGHLNKRGYRYRMWNTNDSSPHVESMEAMYKSIPFFLVLKQRRAFGYFLDNTYETVFDFGKENPAYYSFGATGGNLDYYFIYGPSAKTVVSGYTFLTGRTPLPQLWTLGYQQCRWSYVPEKRLREVAATFRKKSIPCDVLYLDIDYMDGYRVFTWDRKKFSDPKKTLDDLCHQGYKVVTIIDPGVKKDKGYAIYEEALRNGYFVTDRDGVPYVNRVWPGDALYPDFSNAQVRDWWANQLRLMSGSGVAGIWNDMNEPAGFDEPLPDDLRFQNDNRPADHREMHNIYGHEMAKATYEGLKKATGKRPFVITRAAYAGTQKYSTVWTGDNQSLWEHLRMSLPMLMNLGLSGFAFCGTDVGGFGWDCSAELLTRWMQVGTFTPLFRNHSSRLTRNQEPWAFDERTEAICRKYIRLRYCLLPYLYDIMHGAETDGLPMIRPLFLHDQNDSNTYEINDQFLCGEAILVAPVVEQGAKARLVYLPRGDRWTDYWSGATYDGGQYIVRKTPLDLCPIYIRSGSIVPLYPVQQYVGEKKVDTLTLDIYPPASGQTGHYMHYQDDGESFNYQNGEYNLYAFVVDYDRKKQIIHLNFSMAYENYHKKYSSFKFIVNQVQAIAIYFNGIAIKFEVAAARTIFTLKKAGSISILFRR